MKKYRVKFSASTSICNWIHFLLSHHGYSWEQLVAAPGLTEYIEEVK